MMPLPRLLDTMVPRLAQCGRAIRAGVAWRPPASGWQTILNSMIPLPTGGAGLLAALLALAVLPAQAELPKPAISPPVIQAPADADFTRYTLQRGTALQILLQTPVDTAINQVGDPVEGIMFRNLYLGNRLILSKNTRFKGVITRLEPPLQGRNAILAIRFTDILMDNGETLPLSSHVRTEHREHIWGGQVTRGTKPMKSVQRVWGIGEYNRIVYGGPREMGSHIAFQPGEHWTLILDAPLTLVLPQTAW